MSLLKKNKKKLPVEEAKKGSETSKASTSKRNSIEKALEADNSKIGAFINPLKWLDTLEVERKPISPAYDTPSKKAESNLQIKSKTNVI